MNLSIPKLSPIENRKRFTNLPSSAQILSHSIESLVGIGAFVVSSFMKKPSKKLNEYFLSPGELNWKLKGINENTLPQRFFLFKTKSEIERFIESLPAGCMGHVYQLIYKPNFNEIVLQFAWSWLFYEDSTLKFYNKYYFNIFDVAWEKADKNIKTKFLLHDKNFKQYASDIVINLKEGLGKIPLIINCVNDLHSLKEYLILNNYGWLKIDLSPADDFTQSKQWDIVDFGICDVSDLGCDSDRGLADTNLLKTSKAITERIFNDNKHLVMYSDNEPISNFIEFQLKPNGIMMCSVNTAISRPEYVWK
jgi:hypothetical protein